MKLLATAADPATVITQIRLLAPLQAWQQGAPDRSLQVRAWHLCTDTDLAQADVLVLQRPVHARAWGLLRRMQASGGRVVVDMDDLLTEPAPGLQAHAQLRAPASQAALRGCLAAADRITVSTPRLGERLAAMPGLPQGWQAVPNHGFDGGLQAGGARQGAWPTLLLASSDRVALGPLAEALRALQAAPDGPRVVAVGPVAQDLAAAGVACQARPLMPRADFLRLAASLPDPVALIPVGDTPFDACKSAVKFYDFALLGIPVLASDRPPYSDAIAHGQEGWLLADAAPAWQQALQQLQAAPEAGHALAQAAQARVRSTRLLAHSAAAWGDVIAGLPVRTQPARPAAWPARAWRDIMARLRQANRDRLARRSRRG